MTFFNAWFLPFSQKGTQKLIAKYALPWPLLNFLRRTFWYLKHENRLRKKTMSEFPPFWDFFRIFPQKLSPPKTVPCQKPRFLMKFRHCFLDSPFLNRFSCLRYQNVRLEKLSRGHGSAYFAIGLQSSLFSPFFAIFPVKWGQFLGENAKKSQNVRKGERLLFRPIAKYALPWPPT